MLRTENLSIRIDDKLILENITLQLKEGKRTAILGANGCGKSTLLKALSGLNHRYQGRIMWEDKELRKVSRQQLARRLAILPQGATAPADLTVKDLVSYGRFPYRSTFKRHFDSSDSANELAIINDAMRRTKIEHLQYQLVNTLSGGERQRAWIAMALAQQPELLLLDEPTTYLDIAHQLEVMQIITELNHREQMTVIMVLHDMNHALLYADEIIMLKDKGVFAQGTPQEVLTPDNLAAVFGVTAQYYDNKEAGQRIIFPTGLTLKE